MPHDRPDPADRTRFEDALSHGLASLRQTSAGCPDPESLAAFSEDSLPAPDRLELESHLAACTRCQDHLAALVRTEEIEGDIDQAAGASAPGWLDWRWLAPLATTAVVLLAVWAVDPTSVSDSNREMAQSAPTPSSDNAAEGIGGSRENLPLGETSQPPAAASRREQARLDEDQQLAVPPVLEDETVQAEAFSPPERQPVDRPAQSASADRGLAERALSARAAPPLRNRASDLESGLVTASPSPAASWRVTADGEVEHSTDGGVTWTRQLASTGREITAASAPSDSVCWLVGRDGTILRTVDGGASWNPIEAPLDGDVAGVTATDGQTVVITFDDGQAFGSANSGVTWTPQ